MVARDVGKRSGTFGQGRWRFPDIVDDARAETVTLFKEIGVIQ